jgi:hypothetical protein
MTTNRNRSMKVLTVQSLAAAALFVFGLSTPAWSQITLRLPNNMPWPGMQAPRPRPQGPPPVSPPPSQVPPRATQDINLSGPRFGLTLLGEKHMQTLREHDIFLEQPYVSQFGWQFEHRLYTSDDGLSALTEWVPLLSGLEQGVAIPSLNWLVGIRTPSGTEFGLGPNITPAGVGLTLAAGVTIRSGALNIPLNFAVVSSKSGPRVSIMTGFNIRR